MNTFLRRWIVEVVVSFALAPTVAFGLVVASADAAASRTAAEHASSRAQYASAEFCRTFHRAADPSAVPTGVAPSRLALDKTNCDGVVLDDSPFAEPIVRDQRDQSYGALLNPVMRPLGGGEGYGRILARPATVVRTVDELRAALLAAEHSAPSTIYVDDTAEIDLSYCAKTPTPLECRNEPRARPAGCSDVSLAVPANTTLASGRGAGGSRGARLFSRTLTDCPLFEVKGEGVRITGLRFHGPDSSIESDDPLHCGGEARGIRLINDGPARWGTEIDNNELSSWPRAAIEIVRVQGVRVHHNVMQFNRREENDGTCGKNYGLGYGVVVGPGSAVIEANVFDHNRHDIASDGSPGAFYTAVYNLVLDGAVDHSFDVHGGEDRGDCTNIAGSGFVIHHNTFLQAHDPAVLIRGVPMQGAWIYKNETRDDEEGDAFDQTNASGNFHVSDNRYNINRFPAWRVSFGGASFWQWRQFDATATSEVATGDFDGDGAADAMRATPSGWQWSRSAREGWAFLNALNDPVPQLVVGDFVGTGFSDVIRHVRHANGANEWQVSESGTAPWRTLYPGGPPLSTAAFGDFTGDSHTDALFTDGREWLIVGFSPRVVRRHHRQPYQLAELRFGNFVGDSKLDVLRSAGGEWLVWDRVSNTWNHLGFSSIPLSQLTFADFNGDGITDIARSSNGQWLVSWGGKTPWGVLNTSDQDLRSLVVADFSGDRMADVLARHSPAA
jgi:hypothetical protein